MYFKNKANTKMKKITLILMGLVTAGFIYQGCSKNSTDLKSGGNPQEVAASNEGKKLNVLTPESRIEWTASKVTGQHNGTVDISKGFLYTNKGSITGGEFDIDFTSIKVLDLTDTAMNNKLTNHLKSDDFFSASSFPSGKFVLKSITPLSNGTQNNYTLGGILTIKGISKEIRFPASIKTNGDVLTASSDFSIDRTLWDIKFRSGKFYENLGDKMINDEFSIKLNITAK